MTKKNNLFLFYFLSSKKMLKCLFSKLGNCYFLGKGYIVKTFFKYFFETINVELIIRYDISQLKPNRGVWARQKKFA